MRRKPFTVVLLVLVGAVAAIALAKSASVLLREGLYAEEVEGDLDAAIGVYRQIVADASAPREQVAQALYRLGACHMKRKDELEARAAFSRLVADRPWQMAMARASAASSGRGICFMPSSRWVMSITCRLSAPP